ncbi:MAG: type II toxin-antitoxin system RelE/ParE family toxin [Alphaproteobacteria bacterium]|nr:type II toxin-antitoxin system RelE/ParE family toxin [Alphaproteobacteria bacterium]MBM3655048.1 type II toxin-antitoxin system RelE/ParE family toxin [Alphaproteobacteria bacterium]
MRAIHCTINFRKPKAAGRAGYRKYPRGSHVLFYRTTTDGLDIVRILHQQTDFDRHRCRRA